MFRNKLTALEHPTPDAPIDCSNRVQFANTVLWLEDQKIRHYKIEDREPLRAIGTPNWEKNWEAAYEQYKNDVGMMKVNGPVEELSWLLSYAVRLEYLDNVETFKSFTADRVNELNKPSKPTISSSNPFDNLNLVGGNFAACVEKLAKRLNHSTHVDPAITLEASARLIYEKLRPEALNQPKPEGKAFPIKESEQFMFADKNSDEAAKILRLLQIQSVRNVQTSVNENIVAIQEITADPKTDSKLGKVGF
ncbi:RNA transcription, translation and transport factor protein [Pseudolycoriella hygida]|uniref:RNA transcription, translation and transport factor protein n=1 Tax=Pseudolycoriella hygida TaxID=35572 RepID=A0A9Q0RWL3_9DIPT|nr:RNA transcription, translation and transport factor protein [Pseudolycoriella hygida]